MPRVIRRTKKAVTNMCTLKYSQIISKFNRVISSNMPNNDNNNNNTEKNDLQCIIIITIYGNCMLNGMFFN